MGLVSNLVKIVEAITLLFQSSLVLDDQKLTLVSLRDQIPSLLLTIKLALQAKEGNTKKLEKRKEDATELAMLKNKFEDTVELEKMKVAAKIDKAILPSLLEKENGKLTNVTEGVNMADCTIFEIGHQAELNAQHIVSTKSKAGKWPANLAKAQHDKEAT